MASESYPPLIVRLREQEVLLWVLAILFYGVADLVTTVLGLHTGQLIEIGPIAAMVVPYGLGPLTLLKVLTIGVMIGAWRVIPEPHNLGVPLALIGVGVAVTIWNTTMILTVLF